MLRSGLYNLAGAATRLGVTLVTIPLLIRALGLETYGLWTLVSTIVAIVALAEAGLSVATTVFVARELAASDRRALSETVTVTCGAMLLVATAVAAALWTTAGWLPLFPSLDTSQRAIAVEALQVGALAVWLRLLQQALVGVEQAHGSYGTLNILLTVQTTLTNVGMLALALSGGDVVALMGWQVVVGALMLVAHAAVAWRLLRPHALALAWSWPRARAIGHYSLFTWASARGGGAFSGKDPSKVDRSAAYAMPAQPLLPTLGASLGSARQDNTQLHWQIRTSLTFSALMALGIGAALFIGAPLAMTALLGSAADPELVVAFRLASLIYALYSVNAVGYYLLLGLNRARLCTGIQIASGIVALALIAAGTNWGIIGAVAGNAGFLLVWLFTITGMRTAGVALREWVLWLAPLLTWFGATVVLGALLHNNFPLSLAASGIAAIAMGAWLVRRSRAIWEPWLHSYRLFRGG
jgi:O-antigen/teichoic acid export membrane protein